MIKQIKKYLKELWENVFNPVIDIKSIKCPKGYVVYHIDGNKSNNRRKNLIVISRSELARNNFGWRRSI